MPSRSTASAADPVLVEVMRGDLVESRHRGAAAIVDAAGKIVLSWGDIERPVVLRIPFRFGAATVTHAPQAFVRARIRLDDGRDFPLLAWHGILLLRPVRCQSVHSNFSGG